MHTHLFNPRMRPRLMFVEAPADTGSGDTPPDAGTDAPPVGDKGNGDTEGDDSGDSGDSGGDGEQFDAARALAKIKRLNSEAKNLREAKKAAEAKAAAADDQAARAAALEAQNLRLSVALEVGIPAEHLDRIKGTTRDELLADAEVFLGLLGARTPTPPPTQRPQDRPGNGGNPETPIEVTDVRKLGARMFGA